MTSSTTLVGTTFQGKRGRYTPERLLGEGLTAWVFQGMAALEASDPFPVAIKVMKPGLGAEEQRRFRAEAEHLGALRSAEVRSVPLYYENFSTDRAGAPEVLVLELMKGQKVEKLLEAGGPLAEPDGLALGSQLADLLQILHDKLQRTYTDFKFENLWWQADTRELKVTDWNVVSQAGDLSRVSSDLLRAGRYLYTALTAGEVREQGGLVTTPFMRHPSWSHLSLATQNILRKALHRNAERRYQKAADLAIAVRRVQKFWEQEPRRALDDIEDIIGDQYNRESYEQAQEMLDVLRRRLDRGDPRFGLDETARLTRLADQVAARLKNEKDLLTSGIGLFRGYSYAQAQQDFTRALEDDPWALEAWRWREAARAGYATSGFDRLVADVERALDELNAGGHSRADEMLRRLAAQATALDGLWREAHARSLEAQAEQWASQGQQLIEAGQGDTPEADSIFTQAQKAYQDAADALQRVKPDDYRQKLESDLGDLAARGRALADERRSAAAQAGLALREAAARHQAGDWQDTYARLNKGFNAVPGEKRLLEASLGYGQERFRAGDAAMATGFLGLAARQNPLDSEARNWYRAAAAAAAVAQAMDADQWRQGLDQAAEAFQMPLPAQVRLALVGVVGGALGHALQRPASSPDLASLHQAVEQLAQSAQTEPQLSALAGDAQRRWPELAGAWLAQAAPACNASELAEQVGQAMALTKDPGQKPSLAAAALPLVQAKVAQAAGWWRTPGAPELVATARALQAQQAPGSPKPTWIIEEQARLASADLRADVESGQALLAAQRAQQLVAAAPESNRPDLADRLHEPLRLALKAAPPTGDLVLARQMLSVVQQIAQDSQDPPGSAWRIEIAQYEASLEREEQRRRQQLQERVHQRIEGLLRAGDAGSLAQAEDDLDTALMLTPKDTPDYERLVALRNRLSRLQDARLTSSDYGQRAEAFLVGFPLALGRARSAEQFDALKHELDEASEQARKSGEPTLIDRCTEAQRKLAQARTGRERAGQLEVELASLRSQEQQIADELAIPGFMAARAGLWRRIDQVAGDLLEAHPYHDAAQQARQDLKAFQDQQQIGDRLAAYRALRHELGPDLAKLEQAEMHWQDAEPEKARELLNQFKPDWTRQAVDLTERVASGERFLQDAKQLTLSPTLDATFDAHLRDLLAMGLPVAYWQKSGLARWLDAERAKALNLLAGNGKLKQNQVPETLARLVALDQSRRLVTGAPTGRSASAGQGLSGDEAQGFVLEAVRVRREGRGKGMQYMEQALASLPVAEQPAALAAEVQRRAAGALDTARRDRRGRMVRRAGLVAGGLLLAGLLAAVAGWIWPGVAPGSRPALVAALSTATAAAAQPRTTVVTVVITATPTNTPSPTGTPVPPTATPVPPTPTPETPTPTPIPAFQSEDRITQILPDLAKAVKPDGNPIAFTVVVADVVAALDDSDPGSEPQSPNNGPAFVQTPTPGLFGGMRYVNLAAVTDQNLWPEFRWPAAPIDQPGSYQVFVHVPKSHGTARMNYRADLLSAEGAATPLQLAGQDSVELDQSPFSNQWVNLGLIDVSTSGSLRISAKPTGTGAQIGNIPLEAAFDAIAIVWAVQQ